MTFLYSKKFLEHNMEGHPENRDRLLRTIEFLGSKDFFEGQQITEPRTAKPEDILAVHTKKHVEGMEALSRTGPHLRGDTYFNQRTYETALLAAGGVITCIDDGEKRCFALVRPPGHHATRNQAMGFCIFNNVAVGAAYGKKHGYERIAILDFDLHHGNGTQDIFYGDELLYISLHQWPHYPGSGWLDEIGEGSGKGYTINIPLPPGTGDNTYANSLEEIVYPVLSEYSPSLILVSAGYDGHYDDPLGNLNLSTKTYYNIAKETKRLAEKVVFSLEGGYNLSYLPRCIYASLRGLFDLQDDDSDKEQKEEKWVIEKVDERLKYLKKLLKDYWSV